MAVLPILELPDPRLRDVSAPVAEVTDRHRRLIADMFDTMYDAPGIGLAAIQVGVAERLLVIDLQDREEGVEEPVRNPRVFINPELFDPSPERSHYNEGCLSIPEQFAEVERPASVGVRWLDERGGAHEARIDGMLATCLQHEVDHLNGVLFIDHLSRLKRDMVLKKLGKARRQRAA